MAASCTKNAPHARGWRCGKGFGSQGRAASVARRGGPFLRVGVREPGAGVCAPKEENAMKKKNPLGLRVLSAAAVMSIVTSIAAPAFADVYYIGNGSIDVITKTDNDGKAYVEVTQGGKTYNDYSDEIVLKDGTSEDNTTLQEKDRIEGKQAKVATPVETAADAKTSAVATIGETEVTPAEEEPKEEEQEEKVEKKSSDEKPKAEPEEEPEEQEEAPAAEEEPKEEEQEKPAGDEQPKEPVEETDTETDDTEESEDEDAEETEEEDPVEEDEVPKTTEEAAAPTKREIAKAPVKQQPEAAPQEAAAQDDAVAQDDPAVGSETNPTNNVIRVINNWVEKTLNIRLSNVNIKADQNHYESYTTSGSGYSSAMAVEGKGNTKIELDGKNTLDNSNVWGTAGLRKQGTGTMTITDETDDQGEKITSKEFDTDKSGSLTAKGGSGNGGAGIGGSVTQSTENITIEGFATVEATGGNGAGIGGGGSGRSTAPTSGNAKNIIIQGNAHVTAKADDGAGIGGGASFNNGSRKGGSATGIVIQDHAVVNAESTGWGAGIGSGGESFFNDVDVTIGTAGADSTKEDVHVTAKSKYGAAIGSGGDGNNTTIVTIQGHATIDEATSSKGTVIGGIGSDEKNSSATTTVTIKDNAVVMKAQQTDNQINYPAIGGRRMKNVIVNLEGNAYLKEIIGSIGAGFGVKEATVNIKDNVKIGTVIVNDSCYAIGGYMDEDSKVTVNIDGGTDGKVQIGTEGGIGGKCIGSGSINGTAVTVGNNVLMKLKQYKFTNRYGSDFYSRYFCVNKKEADVGSAQNPDPKNPGLINTIGADTEIWYTDYTKKLVKIVHGKNLCVWDEGTVTEQPTCGKPGKKVHHCIYEVQKGAAKETSCCDRTWEEEIPATNTHIWDSGKVTKEATCTEAGVKTYTCTTCNETKTETIKALGHDYEGQEWETTKEATCGAAGEKVLHCKRAPNDPNHDMTEVIPATGNHQWGEWTQTKDPTCTTEGEKKHECGVCGKTETEKVAIDENAHDYRDDWTVTTEPGCTTKGEETRHCHNNPEHTETRDIAPTGHEHTHMEGKKDPTETEPGYTGDEVCDKCGEVVKKGEVIPATGKKDAENAKALELRVVVPGNTLRDLLFTVRQAGTERTYTCKKADATLTGTLETLQYLQANGAETIVFVTNGRVSRFAVADLLALCDEGDVFYLCHTADAEPTLLIIANDHTELLNK